MTAELHVTFDRLAAEVEAVDNGDPNLVCSDCRQVICSIEPGDTLQVLVGTVDDHARSCQQGVPR